MPASQHLILTVHFKPITLCSVPQDEAKNFISFPLAADYYIFQDCPTK